MANRSIEPIIDLKLFENKKKILIELNVLLENYENLFITLSIP